MGSVITAVGLSCVTAGLAGAACRPEVVELRGQAAIAQFSVEVADDAGERGTGLMHRPKMASSAGMLFVYDAPQQPVFWMRNTLIPLDMIFVDPTGTVTRVHENAVPLDETGIDGGPGVQFVLEINGGLARALGIGPGSALRHPVVSQETAVWPCGD